MTLQLQELKVLIVEDNPQAVKYLQMILGKLGVHQAYCSADGREAQRFLDAADDTVNLIICDWEMPRMTGIELLQQVRTVYPDMPFIMLTGNADAESVKRAAKYGVNGYISKPYLPQQIADSLTTLAMTLGPGTWLHRPALHHRPKIPCQQGAVHTWLRSEVRAMPGARPAWPQNQTFARECPQWSPLTRGA